VDEAANDVRDRISRVRGKLPPTVDDPIVAKQDVNAQPIIWLSLNGQGYNTLELTEAPTTFCRRRSSGSTAWARCSSAPSASMRCASGSIRSVSRHTASPSPMSRVHAAGNAEIPSGRVEGQGREFSVRTRGDLQRPEEFAAIVDRQDGDQSVRIGDVADVQVGAEDDRTIARYNTDASIGLGIVKQQKASTVDVAHACTTRCPACASCSPGMQLAIAYDSSTFIEDSIHEVLMSLGVAMLLVVIVIFVFLGSLRATLIPADRDSRCR
jgi:multidrug efflux pump